MAGHAGTSDLDFRLRLTAYSLRVLLLLILSQLKGNRDICRGVDRLAVAGRGTEANELRHPAGLLVQSVAQAVDHALHPHLSGCGKGHAQHHLALDAQGDGLRSCTARAAWK